MLFDDSSDHLETPLLRRYAAILLIGCSGDAATFLRAELLQARSNQDVMRLRGALFECMAMHLGEAEAMDRIRSLDGCA